MATIRDIARLAGVSYSTVSKALNDSPLVKPATKQRILEIARAVNYQKNIPAAQLATGKSMVVGIVFEDIANPLFAHMAARLIDRFDENGYQAILSMAAQAGKLYRHLCVDGILYWGGAMNPSAVSELQDTAVPVVVFGADDHHHLPSVTVDRAEGIRMAIHHLVEQGHRRIGFVGRAEGVKFQAYIDGLNNLGLPHQPAWVLHCHHTWREAYTAMLQCDMGADAPTAWIGSNNQVARGALRALLHRGLRVPEDVSLVGYDDLPEMELEEVPLTTVGPALDDVVTNAVTLLMAAIRHEATVQTVRLMPKLHIRNSVAPRKERCPM
ncbi:catabolite control protein A [Alicyclobacillus cellulosilyticus]|uniref:Catabolite control protein A n=1 Tax=Alicyclobacillus cellulosilyticus TaxID=1003997 RepID=A0A917NFA2_9BACL|nr:LacI family DNA-binding transcriptional regulator [Alicyclobacillus cellulosilyticus]GGI95326.1 catabolite control protein A [Alicyclobacillus cellulosilyticus]